MQRRAGLWFVAVLGVIAVGGIQPAQAGSPHPHFSDGGTLDWTNNLPAARSNARSQGKLIFVEIGNPGCPNCRVLCSDVIPNPRVRQRIQSLAVGCAPDSRSLHPAMRRLFLNNMPRERLGVLPWAAFLTADGQWITGWGGYTQVSTMETHLRIAELRRTSQPVPQASKPRQRRFSPPTREEGPQAGTVPPGPETKPEPDSSPRILLSSKTGEGKCLGGSCGPDAGSCTDGSCLAPGMTCEGGSCLAPGFPGGGACANGACDAPLVAEAPDRAKSPVLAPVIPWTGAKPGAVPSGDDAKSSVKMASKSDDLYAVGSPDSQSTPVVPPALRAQRIADSSTSLPPPTVRKVDGVPTVANPWDDHPGCDAGELLSGDPDAEIVAGALVAVSNPMNEFDVTGPIDEIARSRAPTYDEDTRARTQPIERAPAPESSPAGSGAGSKAAEHLEAAIDAARNGEATEAERLVYLAMREVRSGSAPSSLKRDAEAGREALREWREAGLMPSSSLVRKHIIRKARTRFASSRWLRLFE